MEDTSTQPTPQLLTEIQFNVARKGYDPGEVDAFLERLSAAVTQMQDKLRQSAAAAQAAQRQASEAVRANEVLQARIDELESGAVFAPVADDISPELEAEQAASILAMARRTADAVVNDARTSAATLVTDAETEAANILRDAKVKADATVGDLDAKRQELRSDAAALEAFLNEQRALLSAGLAQIQAVLDDPRALRIGAPPVLEAPVLVGDDEPVVPSSDFPTMATPTVVDEQTSGEEPTTTGTGTVFALEDLSSAPAAGTEGSDFDPEPAEGGELFGAKDDEVDEAMRKFFDANFDDDQRFGR
jgi:cell division initiation protein